MHNQLTVVVADDETISIDGRRLPERAELVDALQSAVQRDPNLLVVIEPTQHDDYKGIGKVIYASQYAGVPVENLRITMENGDVVSFDELRARNSAPPA